MANTVQIKRHSSNSTDAAPGTLASGELALNQAGKKLYIGRHNNSSVEVFHLPTLEDITAGNGISKTAASSNSNDNAQTLAVDVSDSNIFASTSAKGIASFSSDNFDVSSGVVTIKTGGVVTAEIAADAITGAKLADDAIDSEHITDGSIDTAHIADNNVTAAKIEDNVALPGNCSSTGNFTVGGNLTVNGTTTTVNSTTTTLDDPIMTLGGDSAPGSDDNKDRGIEFRYHTGSAAKVGFFGYDDSDGLFKYIPDASNSSEVFSGSLGGATFSTLTLTGALDGATVDGGTY
jgi:hypothetical protein